MAKRQTRRSLSVAGLTYQRLKKWCEANGKAACGVTEALITEFLDAQGAPQETVLRPRPVQPPKRPAYLEF